MRWAIEENTCRKLWEVSLSDMKGSIIMMLRGVAIKLSQ
jgi:hypothetical protein